MENKKQMLEIWRRALLIQYQKSGAIMNAGGSMHRKVINVYN
jgi:hypothetical protein